MPHEEFQRFADDLARAVIVVSGIETVLTGRVVEDGEIDCAFTSAPDESVRAFERRRAIPPGTREEERWQVQRLCFERGHARPLTDPLLDRRAQARAERCQVPERVEACRAPEPVGTPLQQRRKPE